MYLLHVGDFQGLFCQLGLSYQGAKGIGILGVVFQKLCMDFDLWCFSFQDKCSPGFSRVRLSEDASLQYIHSSETLTLTLNHTAGHLLEADIKLFRKYFWDRAFLVKVCAQMFWYTIVHTPLQNTGIYSWFWEQYFFGGSTFFLMKHWGHGIGNY